MQKQQMMKRIRSGIAAEKAGPHEETDNGNGALMRILPSAIYLAGEDDMDSGSTAPRRDSGTGGRVCR